MQKVESSSLFSRFIKKTLLMRGFFVPFFGPENVVFRPALPLGATKSPLEVRKAGVFVGMERGDVCFVYLAESWPADKERAITTQQPLRCWDAGWAA
jgi:hypothetical protein